MTLFNTRTAVKCFSGSGHRPRPPRGCRRGPPARGSVRSRPRPRSGGCCGCRRSDPRRGGRDRRRRPISTVPKSLRPVEKIAGFEVAVCSASSGVKPASTKRSSSWWRLKPGSTPTPAGVSVPARNGTPARRMRPTISSSCRTNSLPDRQRIRGEVLEDALRELGPGLLAPRGRRVPQVRVLRHVDDVDQPLAALPVERRALPGPASSRGSRGAPLSFAASKVSRKRAGPFLPSRSSVLCRASCPRRRRSGARSSSGRRRTLRAARTASGTWPANAMLPLAALLGDREVGVARERTTGS